MKKYYIFRVDYSQTDSSMVIVQADSVSQAESWLKRHGEHGPRYVTYYGEQGSIPIASDVKLT